jgi:hypothetical protein
MPCSILKVVWVMGVGGEWGWKGRWMDGWVRRDGMDGLKGRENLCKKYSMFALLCYRMVVRTGNDGY